MDEAVEPDTLGDLTPLAEHDTSLALVAMGQLCAGSANDVTLRRGCGPRWGAARVSLRPVREESGDLVLRARQARRHGQLVP